MIKSTGRRMAPWGVDRDDLWVAGAMGVLDALSRFEPNRGWRFSTYAHWWVRAYQSQVAREHLAHGFVAHPTNRSYTTSQIVRERARVESLFLHEDVVRTISEHLGVSTRRVDRILRSLEVVISLDESVGSKPGRTRLDTMRQEGPGADEVLEEREQMVAIQELVAEALEHLPGRDRRVIQMRFFDNMTLEAIGREIGVSRERVRQLEARSLNKMRKYLKVNPRHP
jgi:RNA polymerase sigma-32 factor